MVGVRWSRVVVFGVWGGVVVVVVGCDVVYSVLEGSVVVGGAGG